MCACSAYDAGAELMRPASSVIAFTVLSGAGYGLLACAAIDLMSGATCVLQRCEAIEMAASASVRAPFLAAVLLIALALTMAGLGFSVLHLGRPGRVWRALSQWRSSWLSREGVSATASILAAALAIALLWRGDARGIPELIVGLLVLVTAVTTVFCTARIYTSLPPVPAWCDRRVLPGYFLLAAVSGLALWLALAGVLLGKASAWQAALLSLLALAAIALKWSYWREIDGLALPSAARMTGLDRIGAARSFDAPHTEANYLTREMGFMFARRHARQLRAFVLLALALLAALSLAVALAEWVPMLSQQARAHPALASAGRSTLLAGSVICVFAAIFVERWLFFAQARHMVMAYYAK